MTTVPQKTHWKVLFICVGNSCRSQMAEAFANQRGGGKIRAWSAGSHPLGSVIPRTRAVLEEKGISSQGQWSKGLLDVPLEEMDVVVTMGSEVDFALPGGFAGHLVEWDIPDPYGYDLDSYREIRDLIERKVAVLLTELQNPRPPEPLGNAREGESN